MRSFILHSVALVLLTPCLCFARDVAVIADKNNAASLLTNKDLLKLVKTAKWPDGRKATIFLSDPNSAEGKLFLDKTCNMTPGELKSFAETQKAIVILASDDQVVKAVSENPGSIGVVNVFSISSTVKVLKVDGKLPLEQGYMLHGN